MTTDEPLTADPLLATGTILDAFASAGRVLPRAALKQAADRWPEVGPGLLAALQSAADGTDRSDRTNTILFFGIYLMAQVRETRAFRPLCAVAADGERIFRLIGDGVTEDLCVILTRVYDGDPAPLRMLIEAADADEYARAAALDALAWLTATGSIDRNDTARYLRDLYMTLRPQQQCHVWVGWQRAIAHLGLDELVSLVENAFDRGWIDRWVVGRHPFHDDLCTARQAADPTSVFDRHLGDDGRLDDIVRHLSLWAAFNPEEERMPESVMAPKLRASGSPIRDPFIGVGRNAPCPCGSGKKFKKCCLGKAG
jgi:uncharacterized protein